LIDEIKLTQKEENTTINQHEIIGYRAPIL